MYPGLCDCRLARAIRYERGKPLTLEHLRGRLLWPIQQLNLQPYVSPLLSMRYKAFGTILNKSLREKKKAPGPYCGTHLGYIHNLREGGRVETLF